MKKFRLKLFVTTILLSVIYVNLFANDGLNKYDSMINAFLLGLEDKGREIAHEILSEDRYSNVQEQTLFFVAEKFLTDGIRNDDNDKFMKAHRLYSTFIDRFPDSEYMGNIVYRKNFIESQVAHLKLFLLYDYFYSAEVEIIQSKLNVAELFLNIIEPNPYKLFLESEYNQDGVTIMNKYLSDIMINHPMFEVYGYYQKILISLDAFDGVTTTSKGIAEEAPHRNLPISRTGYHGQIAYSLLDEMSEKYPAHPLTLDLHLLFGKIFMERSGDRIDRQTLDHLQFILRNDPDKLSPRYLLAREFVENNSFHD